MRRERERRQFYNCAMKDKPEIVNNWLPRYTCTPLDAFGVHVLP